MLFAFLLPNTDDNRTNLELGIIAIIGAAFGYLVKYYFDKRQAFASDNAAIKRGMYDKYLEGLQKTFGELTDKENRPTETDIKRINAEFIRLNKAFYATSILYGSPRVIRKYADFVRHLDVPVTQQKQFDLMIKLSRLYKAMRKDIGLSSRLLGIDGELLLRGTLSDYDTTIRPYAKLRSRAWRWIMGK